MFSKSLCIDTLWTDFYGWSKLEYLWLFIVTAGIVGVSLATNAGPLEFVSSVTGIIGALLVAKGKLSSYIWGVIATVTYVVVAYKFNLKGEFFMYLLVFTPMQVIGYFMWLKYMRDGKIQNTHDVVKKFLTWKQRGYLLVGTVLGCIAYAAFLDYIRGSLPGLDSCTSILSLVATYLLMKRYSEQWLVWIVTNCIAVYMWCHAAGDNGGYAILMMWILFLLNSIYGAVMWFIDNKAKPNATPATTAV